MKTITKAGRMPFSKLSKLQNEGKIYLDESFQSNARWDVAAKQAYMYSVFVGNAVTSIILADIQSIVASLRIAFSEDNEDYNSVKIYYSAYKRYNTVNIYFVKYRYEARWRQNIEKKYLFRKTFQK